MSRKTKRMYQINNLKKDEKSCGVITKEEQLKAMKARSTDYQLPRCGFHMTEKDRPRKRFKPRDYA